MVGAFQLYNTPFSRADGGNFTYEDVKGYLDSMGNEENGGISVSSNAQLKQIIKDAINESNEDRIVFTLFNHDFMQRDVAAINMVLNLLALIIAVATLIKQMK